MPGDTKITRTADGWIDVDNPTAFHKVRRLARDARRASRGCVRPTDQVTGPTLTSLQTRLLNRMTQLQGVDADDALDVITSNGYNKAASYGHMRAAGANHSEALYVIGLNAPDVSLAYGLARFAGEDHTEALKEALGELDDD